MLWWEWLSTPAGLPAEYAAALPHSSSAKINVPEVAAYCLLRRLRALTMQLRLAKTSLHTWRVFSCMHHSEGVSAIGPDEHKRVLSLGHGG